MVRVELTLDGFLDHYLYQLRYMSMVQGFGFEPKYLSEQIYSLSHLTALPSLHFKLLVLL